jgi:hypothetical protein
MTIKQSVRLLLAPMLAMALLFGLMPTASASSHDTASLTGRTIGNLEAVTDGGVFEGRITNLQIVDGLASGVLRGTLDGENVRLPFSGIPVPDLFSGSPGSCQILFLDLGPIFLDLLGLIVETSPIQVEIRAERGPGNLLGNLLCALVGIFDPV